LCNKVSRSFCLTRKNFTFFSSSNDCFCFRSLVFFKRSTSLWSLVASSLNDSFDSLSSLLVSRSFTAMSCLSSICLVIKLLFLARAAFVLISTARIRNFLWQRMQMLPSSFSPLESSLDLGNSRRWVKHLAQFETPQNSQWFRSFSFSKATTLHELHSSVTVCLSCLMGSCKKKMGSCVSNVNVWF